MLFICMWIPVWWPDCGIWLQSSSPDSSVSSLLHPCMLLRYNHLLDCQKLVYFLFQYSLLFEETHSFLFGLIIKLDFLQNTVDLHLTIHDTYLFTLQPHPSNAFLLLFLSKGKKKWSHFELVLSPTLGNTGCPLCSQYRAQYYMLGLWKNFYWGEGRFYSSSSS